jgi:hypothetical protein
MMWSSALARRSRGSFVQSKLILCAAGVTVHEHIAQDICAQCEGCEEFELRGQHGVRWKIKLNVVFCALGNLHVVMLAAHWMVFALQLSQS